MTAPKLTKPQQELLAEIKASSTGGLWITAYKRYDRTATALLRKGFVKIAGVAPKTIFYVAVEES